MTTFRRNGKAPGQAPGAPARPHVLSPRVTCGTSSRFTRTTVQGGSAIEVFRQKSVVESVPLDRTMNIRSRTDEGHPASSNEWQKAFLRRKSPQAAISGRVTREEGGRTAAARGAAPASGLNPTGSGTIDDLNAFPAFTRMHRSAIGYCRRPTGKEPVTTARIDSLHRRPHQILAGSSRALSPVPCRNSPPADAIAAECRYVYAEIAAGTIMLLVQRHPRTGKKSAILHQPGRLPQQVDQGRGAGSDGGSQHPAMPGTWPSARPPEDYAGKWNDAQTKGHRQETQHGLALNVFPCAKDPPPSRPPRQPFPKPEGLAFSEGASPLSGFADDWRPSASQLP